MNTSSKALLISTFCLLFSGQLFAGEPVSLGGSYASLNNTGAATSLILIAGNGGKTGIGANGKPTIMLSDVLVRNQNRFSANTLLIDEGVSISSAVSYMRNKYNGPVYVAAVSQSTLRVKEIAAARPNGIIIVSGLLNLMMKSSTGAALPKMLAIHHRNDPCGPATPFHIPKFQNWGGGNLTMVLVGTAPTKLAKVKKTEGTAPAQCRSSGAHGLVGYDGTVVSAINGFVR